jgi:hypothetical protein
MAGPTRRNAFWHNDDFTHCQWGTTDYFHQRSGAKVIQHAWEKHCRGEGPTHYLEFFELPGLKRDPTTARIQHCFRRYAAASLGTILVEPRPGFWWINPAIPKTDESLLPQG